MILDDSEQRCGASLESSKLRTDWAMELCDELGRQRFRKDEMRSFLRFMTEMNNSRCGTKWVQKRV